MTAHAPAAHRGALRRLPSGAGWLLGFVVVVIGLAGVMVARSLPAGLLAGSAPLVAPREVGDVALDADPDGLALAVVLVDGQGNDLPLAGTLDLRLELPTGEQWHDRRAVTPADFSRLPPASALAGRLGYRVVVPRSAWVTPPRAGDKVAVYTNVEPTAGAAFTSLATPLAP